VLTKSQIEKATPPAEGRVVLWDGELSGFGCRISASGKRSFIARYRLPGSRTMQTATLGTYGLITLSQARSRAQELLAKVKLGGDPQAERKARAAAQTTQARALTVRELVRQYAAALRAGTAKTRRSNGRPVPAYVADTVLHLERFAATHGRQPAAAITRADVVNLLNDYVDQPSAHRRLHGAIKRMYGWARQQELVTNNPTDDIVTTQAPARERVLSLAELAQIWRAAEQLDPLYRDLVHLMILTGQRRAEIAGMRWGEIDLARALWILPAARTKARRQHAIPLPDLAVTCLQVRRDAFQRLPRPDDLVLPTIGRDGKEIAPVSGWNWLKREIDRRIGIPPWRLHDFRRSLVTICAEHGVDVAVLDSVLNHAASATRGGVIGVYQRATLIEPMRKLMALWDKLLTGAVTSGEVVVFPPRPGDETNMRV
jgi:integrase